MLRLPKGRIAQLFNLQHILNVLRNPRANPQEAVLLAGMIVIVGLLILTILLLVFARPAPGKRRAKKRRRIPLRALGFVLGFGIFVSLLVGSLSISVSQSRLCNLCHQMKKSYNSWKTSSHARTDCITCHQKPGLFGFVTYELDRIGDVRIYVREAISKSKESSEPIRSDVASQSCLRCHEEQVSKTFVARSIRVRHKDFLEAGQRCTLCHNTAGHGKEVTNPKYPSMSLCTQCHNGKKVSADCKICHSKDIGVLVRREEASVFSTVTIGRPTTCRGCHSIESCNNCHGLELPHPPDWTRQVVLHAAPAAFEKKQLCLKCHSIMYCNRCHSFPGHDPNTWKRDHAISGSSPQPNCENCHVALKGIKDFCSLCHAR